MKKVALGFVAASVALMGCGGTNGLVPSLYVGSYSGTYSAPGLPQTGTVNLSVDQFGNLSGITTSSTGASSNISGNIDNGVPGNLTNGKLTSQSNSSSVATFTGTLSATGTNSQGQPTLTGTLTVVVSSTSTVTDTWSLAETVTGLSSRQR